MTKKFYNNTYDVERFVMENCAMILKESMSSEPGRIFKCKICHRSFETFQALGGHTASHKRPKLDTESQKQQQHMKPHKCNICNNEFWTGQALGGHMRKHRSPNNISSNSSFLGIENNSASSTVYSSTVTSSDDHSEQKGGSEMMNDKRILGLDLKMVNTNFDDKRILGLDLKMMNTNFDEKRILGLDLKMVNTNFDGKRILGLDLNLSPEENEFKYFQN